MSVSSSVRRECRFARTKNIGFRRERARGERALSVVLRDAVVYRSLAPLVYLLPFRTLKNNTFLLGRHLESSERNTSERDEKIR